MIKDIELRFVERVVHAPELGPNIAKKARILEMRKLVERQWAETWFVDGREVPRSGIDSDWTPWTEVPLVGIEP